jgi:hypothetical protein
MKRTSESPSSKYQAMRRGRDPPVALYRSLTPPP